MTYFLRTQSNQTIFSIDFGTKTDYYPNKEEGVDKHTFHELSAYVDIVQYSKFLLAQPEEKQPMIIQLFDQLSEYRGWLWEQFYMGRKNTGSDEDKNKISEHLDRLFKGLAEQFGLNYVTD